MYHIFYVVDFYSQKPNNVFHLHPPVLSISCYIAKNNSGTVFFTFTINGTFTVSSHGSAFCTKASYTYSIKDSAWEFKSATAERSANKAIGDAKFIRKALLVVVSTIEPHVVLTCDNNGNFS